MQISSVNNHFLETTRLYQRNWQDCDRDFFHFINSDETVMEFFSIRRDKKTSDKLMNSLRQDITNRRFGLAALVLKKTDEVIGFCGLTEATAEGVFPQGTIEIGWRLAPQFWGNGYVTEMGKALIKFGFTELKLDEILSFAVPENIRSTAVMKRIGMSPDPSRNFSHPQVTAAYPHLKQHVTYSIKRPKKAGA